MHELMGDHYELERKVMVKVIDDDGSVEYHEEYRVVCGTCVPKYSEYRPWPWHDPKAVVH